jgi:hypothetical protein
VDLGVAEGGVEEVALVEELGRVFTTCQMAVALCPMGCGSLGSNDVGKTPPTGRALCERRETIGGWTWVAKEAAR